GREMLAVDHNVYFHETGSVQFSLFNGGNATQGGEFSFEEWQARGFDTHSMVTDPQLDDVFYPLNQAVQDAGVGWYSQAALTVMPIGSTRVNEGQQTRYAVVRSGTSFDQPLTVSLSASDDSEVQFPQSVTIPAGSHKAYFDVVAVGDGLDDGSRAVQLTASAAGFDTTIPHWLRVDDYGPAAALTVENVTVREGDGIATFSVSLSKPLGFDVSIDVNYTSDTARAADFDTATDTVTFAAGSTAAQTVTVAITDDDVVELSETFTVSLAVSPSTPAGGRNVDVSDIATGTITDNDTAVFTVEDVTVDEGAGTAALTVAVSKAPDVDVTIDVSYAAATASVADFDSGSDSLTFPAGSTASQTVTVAISDDDLAEPSESFTATLAVSGSASLGNRNINISDTATVTIMDDDTTLGCRGNVDGDDDFDANDSFLIILVLLSGSNQQIDLLKGGSPLTAQELRDRITSLFSTDIDGDGDFDANDSFLIHLVKLSGTNEHIELLKGASLLTATRIRAAVEALSGGSASAGSTSAPLTAAAPANSAESPVAAAKSAVHSLPVIAVTSLVATEDELLFPVPVATEEFSCRELTGQSESDLSATVWADYRQWIDFI
ncbi:MAG: hypothetical protein KDA89_07390, partial [Planctomycetaceae bacterium]|nr:hypothetical protein [Planctomycetaceae bacterium]